MPSKYRKPKFTNDQFTDAKNPFLEMGFIIPVNRKISKGTLHKEDGLWIPKEYDLESERTTKVYIKSGNRLITSKFNSSAKSLLLWLLFEVDYSKDYLWINKVRYMEENNVSSVNTYKTGLAELIRCGVLSESFIRGVYWINPRLLFSGSRVNKYPDHVKVLSTYEKDDKEAKVLSIGGVKVA